MRRMLSITCAVLFMGGLTTPGSAGVIFTPGNKPQSDEENILLNGSGSGATVFGTAKQSALQVAFSSITDTLNEPSNGQARITAADGHINNLTISLPGGTFGDLIINPFKGDGSATLTALVN